MEKKYAKKKKNNVNYCCRCGGTVIPPHHLHIVIINSSHYTIFLRVKMCFSHVDWINFKWIFFYIKLELRAGQSGLKLTGKLGLITVGIEGCP